MVSMRKRIARHMPLLIIVLLITASAGNGQVGSLLSHVTLSNDCGVVPGAESGVGTGITFDGTNLWYSCYNSKRTTNPNDLYKANPNTGAVITGYNIAGGLGAIAYDATRNVIWAGEGGGCNDVPTYGCDNQGKVIKIPLDANKNATNGSFTVAFAVPDAYASPIPLLGSTIDLVDGLAIDTIGDTLYLHYDYVSTIAKYNATTGAFLGFIDESPGIPVGTPVITPPSPLTTCVVSGLAIGGVALFEASDYCDHVWTVDKTSLGPLFDFSITAGVPVSTFDEKALTCDTRTFFPSLGEHALWVKDAFTPDAYAFDIPLSSCGIGGLAAPTATPSCPLGQGFWKNHGSQWPVTTLALGGRTYTESQLLTILGTPPQGDASLILARQLIATKLDIANGSDPTPVSAAVAAADTALLAVGPLPAGIKASTTAGHAMTAAATILDNYNNDRLTPTCTAFIPSGPASH